MFWRKKKRKIQIKITFHEKTREIEILCIPKNIKATQIIQILMWAIDTINKASFQGYPSSKKEKKKKTSQSYIQ